MTRAGPAAAAALAAAVVTILFIAAAGPAAASCALPPQPSSHRFTGTVVQTADRGTTATIRTDDGRTVIVSGGAGGPGVITSVDRAFRPGVRYEFHPLNDASPYRDNACTATHEIGAASDRAQDETSSEGWLGWQGSWPALAVLAGILLIVVATTARRTHVGRVAGTLGLGRRQPDQAAAD